MMFVPFSPGHREFNFLACGEVHRYAGGLIIEAVGLHRAKIVRHPFGAPSHVASVHVSRFTDSRQRQLSLIFVYRS